MAARAKAIRKNPNAAEDRVWSLLRAHRLAGLKFRRKHVLGRYIADFVCNRARLVIEIDGDTHATEVAEMRDPKRTEKIEQAGYRVIQFCYDYALNDTDGGVVKTILEALRSSALPAHEKARLAAEGVWASSPSAPSSPSALTLTLSRSGRGSS